MIRKERQVWEHRMNSEEWQVTLERYEIGTVRWYHGLPWPPGRMVLWREGSHLEQSMHLPSPAPASFTCHKFLSLLDFPGGSVVKNLPANAADTGSIPDPGKFPHSSEQLSLGATTVEPVL